MTVISRTVPLPVFIQIAAGSLKQLLPTLTAHRVSFQRPLVLSQEPVLASGGQTAVDQLQAQTILIQDNGMREVDRVIQEVRRGQQDVIIAMGGGRVLDVGKLSAHKLQLNYILIPSSPSNDSIASPFAVIKDAGGQSQSLPVHLPLGILVDLDLMRQAPPELIRSGVGDLLSNISALKDWKLGEHDRGESVDDFAFLLSNTAVETLYGPFCAKPTIDLKDPDFLYRLVQGLIMSGMSASIAGSSRPFSGGEHEISHAMDTLFPGSGLHGQQVAYGTLITEEMRGSDWRLLATFFKAVGLPTSFRSFQLNEDQMVQAIRYAPQTRPDRYTIIERLNLSESQIRQVLFHVERSTPSHGK